jgi:hypothetical protein
MQSNNQTFTKAKPITSCGVCDVGGEPSIELGLKSDWFQDVDGAVL